MADMVKTVFRSAFHSDREARMDIVDIIAMAVIREAALRGLSFNELRLVIDEAVTNAMEHGNSWESGKFIQVEIEHRHGGIAVSIEDEGQGFNPRRAIRLISESKDRLRLRGRGLAIISRFCMMKWNRKGNRITLLFQS
jgi:anti-sigma regulatory factor (Ser/Thr protein kinase)